MPWWGNLESMINPVQILIYYPSQLQICPVQGTGITVPVGPFFMRSVCHSGVIYCVDWRRYKVIRPGPIQAPGGKRRQYPKFWMWDSRRLAKVLRRKSIVIYDAGSLSKTSQGDWERDWSFPRDYNLWKMAYTTYWVRLAWWQVFSRICEWS